MKLDSIIATAVICLALMAAGVFLGEAMRQAAVRAQQPTPSPLPVASSVTSSAPDCLRLTYVTPKCDILIGQCEQAVSRFSGPQAYIVKSGTRTLAKPDTDCGWTRQPDNRQLAPDVLIFNDGKCDLWLDRNLRLLDTKKPGTDQSANPTNDCKWKPISNPTQ